MEMLKFSLPIACALLFLRAGSALLMSVDGPDEASLMVDRVAEGQEDVILKC